MTNINTPNTSFLCKLFPNVYEPAEDTFLLLDVLENDFLLNSNPFNQRSYLTSLEMGSGSGCVSVFLSQLVAQKRCSHLHYCTDINSEAVLATLELAKRTERQIATRFEILNTSFVSGFDIGRLKNTFDVILFNPPYVPTTKEELGSNSIEAAWAGGENGREVLDEILPLLPDLLAANGVLYLVGIEQNNPLEIIDILNERNVSSTIVSKRKAGRESLFILKGTKH